MTLFAYNLTISPVTLVASSGTTTLPASSKAGERGPAVNVTGDLRGLTGGQYAALEKQRVGTLDYEWSGEPEYKMGALRVQPGLGLQLSINVMQSRKIAKLQKQAAQIRRRMEDAMNGDVVIEVIPAGPLTRTAAELNAAAAGTLKERITVRLKNADGLNQLWAGFALTIDLAESVVDTDVGPPTIDPTTVNLVMGTAKFDLIYDTDDGATKTYAAADSMSATIRTSAADDLLGWPVVSKTLTINVS